MGFGNLPRVETGPGSSIVDEDKRILEIPAWEKLLALRTRRPGNFNVIRSYSSRAVSTKRLSQSMVQQNA
jgi:hypothetical protein